MPQVIPLWCVAMSGNGRSRRYCLKRYENGLGYMLAVIWNTKNNKVTVASDPRGEGLAPVR